MKAREFVGSTCLEVYLVHFEWVAKINKWKDQEMVDYLLTAQKGPALEVVYSLDEE